MSWALYLIPMLAGCIIAAISIPLKIKEEKKRISEGCPPRLVWGEFLWFLLVFVPVVNLVSLFILIIFFLIYVVDVAKETLVFPVKGKK